MTGISIRIEGDAREKLKELIDRIEDKAEFFKAASDTMYGQTMDRFNAETGPSGSPWKPLADDTVELRGGSTGPILQAVKTVDNRLRKDIHAAPEPNRAVVKTGMQAYAAIHQFGGKAGRGHKVTIPARPYLGFSDENIEELLDVAESALLGD